MIKNPSLIWEGKNRGCLYNLIMDLVRGGVVVAAKGKVNVGSKLDLKSCIAYDNIK